MTARKSPGGQTVSFTARVIVNCAGNYSDAVHKLLVLEEGKKEDLFQITPGEKCTYKITFSIVLCKF